METKSLGSYTDGMYLTFQYENRKIHFIPKKTVEEAELQDVLNLKDYLKREFEAEFPLEIVFEGKILDLYPIPWQETTKKNPIRVYLRYIRNTNTADENMTEIFFEQHNINLEVGIMLDCGFDNCIEALKDESIKDFQIHLIQRAYKKHYLMNEATKGNIIDHFLEETFDDMNYKITSGYTIEVLQEHTAVSDHAILDRKAQREILIIEDEKCDLTQAILRNFDQLMSYSLSIQGRSFPFIYGIASTLNQWVFCCYIPPKTGMTVAYNNFLVSRVIYLNLDQDQMPTVDSVKTILAYIKGFLRPNVDEIVFNK